MNAFFFPLFEMRCAKYVGLGHSHRVQEKHFNTRQT